jgi:hypothetical protein
MNISVVTLVNDEKLYQEMVVKSLRGIPDIYPEFIPITSTESCKGINQGVKLATNDLIIICHQDVFFPHNWISILESQLNKIPKPFGVIGTFGRDLNLKAAGRIYNPHPILRVGLAKNLPVEAISLDEHCLIISKTTFDNYHLQFDEGLKYFHIYGADICLSAHEKGLKNYVIDSSLNHLSPKGKNDRAFDLSVKWLIKKWQKRSDYKLFRTMTFEVEFETGNWIKYL